MRTMIYSLCNALLCMTIILSGYSNATIPQPKLVLQITIDQFAGNQLDRFQRYTNKGGFAYLLKHGYWYDNAHQPHATTQTAVGHATLATGTVPSLHGIIANWWWDPKTASQSYAFADPHSPILGDNSINKQHFGRSPRNLQSPSFSDLLGMSTQGKAKRYALSTKDRGAIPLAGHSGKAYWYDGRTGQYVTSHYYEKSLPSWLAAWNKKNIPHQYIGKSWHLSSQCNSYIYCQDQLKHFNSTEQAYKTSFPHPFGDQTSTFQRIIISPYGDVLTMDVAKALLKDKKLGQGKETDFLAISLSATDAIGHTFGPYSIESEENFIILNKELGRFFDFIDTQVGLDNTLIVLSADHGIAPSPTYLQQFNYPSFELTLDEISQQDNIKSLLNKYQLSWQKLVTASIPDLYLDKAYLKSKNIKSKLFIRELAEALTDVPGIATAVSKHQIKHNHWQHPMLRRPLVNQIHTNRSGDIYLVAEPFHYISKVKYQKAHHGTPWRYDTHVPIIIAHPSFKAKRIHRKTYTTDVVPTLTALLHISPPAMGVGNVLPEFVK